MTEKAPKKVWNPPKLTVFGSVEELTLCNKTYGSSDGNTFMGSSIVCSSSSTG